MPRSNNEVDALIANSAALMRKGRSGDLFPAVEYDWNTHGHNIGIKGFDGNWVSYIFISQPLCDPKEFGRYLKEFGTILCNG